MMRVLLHLLSPSSEMYTFLHSCIFCKCFSSSTLAAEWRDFPVIRRRDSRQGITFLQSGSISFNQLFPLATYYLLVTLRYSLNWSSLTLGSLSQSRRSQPQSRRMVRAEVNWSDKFACLVGKHMGVLFGSCLVPGWVDRVGGGKLKISVNLHWVLVGVGGGDGEWWGYRTLAPPDISPH